MSFNRSGAFSGYGIYVDLKPGSQVDCAKIGQIIRSITSLGSHVQIKQYYTMVAEEYDGKYLPVTGVSCYIHVLADDADIPLIVDALLSHASEGIGAIDIYGLDNVGLYFRRSVSSQVFFISPDVVPYPCPRVLPLPPVLKVIWE